MMTLAAETVQSTSLTFKGIDNIHGSDGFPLGVLGVSDSVPDDVLEEDLKNTAGFLVDEAGDTFDTTSPGETTNSGLGNTLDVVS